MVTKAIEEKLSSFSLQIFKKGGDLAWTLNIFITEKRKDLTS
ncbi:replication initiator A N-terminal domain protein [Streptococcus pneumoniae GA02254]|nr:replication initiator A N-terminal domain protein [Streptococcus pneumoniae GA02254]